MQHTLRDIQAELNNVFGLRRRNSTVSLHSVASFAAQIGDKNAFEDLCKELQRIGVTEDMINSKKSEIFSLFQRIVDMKAQTEPQAVGNWVAADPLTVPTSHLKLTKLAMGPASTPPNLSSGSALVNTTLRPFQSGSFRARAHSPNLRTTAEVEDNDISIPILKYLLGITNFTPEWAITQALNKAKEEGSTIDYVWRLLNTGVLIYGMGSRYKRALLHLARAKYDTNMVHLLLRQGANVDTTHFLEEQTSPHLAVAGNRIEATRGILEKGGSVDAMTRRSKTPLYLAAANNNMDMVQLLLEKGASINAMTGLDNGTPPPLAATNSRRDMVRQLLEKGVSVNAMTNKYKRTLLSLAVENRNIDMVRLLLEKGALVNPITKQLKMNLLHLAAANGDVAIVQLLLEKGASVDGVSDNSWGDLTTLQRAVMGDHVDVVRLLLEKGAFASIKTGCDVLHLAAGRSRAEIVRLLLERGAAVNGKASWSDSETLLHRAVELGRAEVVKLLLENGSWVGHTARYSWTPLQMAAKRGDADIVKLLLEKGANIDATDSSFERAPIHIAIARGSMDIVRLLLEKGASVHATTYYQRTPLHFAAWYGSIEMVQLLLEWNAPIDAMCSNRETPLHWAQEARRSDVVQLMKEWEHKLFPLIGEVDLGTRRDVPGLYSGTKRRDVPGLFGKSRGRLETKREIPRDISRRL